LLARARAAPDVDVALPEGFEGELRDYQREGYEWLSRLAHWGAGAVLADEMGLGKTIQTLALLSRRASEGPALVVAPTSVGPNWMAEAARFTPSLKTRAYRGPKREAMLADLSPGDVLVTSYDVLARDGERLAGIPLGTLVLDEAQAVKNVRTRRAQAAAGLQAGYRVALTGTPLENHLGELYSLYRIVAPGLLGSWPSFRQRYALPIERDGDDATRARLAARLRPFLLRRTKDAVAPELPPRTDVVQPVELSEAERRLYEAARRDALTSLADVPTSGRTKAAKEGRFAILAALTRLRRLACHPRLVDASSTVRSSKLAAFLELTDELRQSGRRALVFSQFTSHLAIVREALDLRGIDSLYLDGSTPAGKRARLVERFQEGESGLFLISLKAGGTGLNLTGADTVVHLDPWWNPATEDQASDRAHRIGQTRPVTVVRLVAQGTIEEQVLALHDQKRELADAILEGSDRAARLSKDELVGLLAGDADTPTGADEE
ncbi:MAG: DEAD/DEAH box helicase, partial [Myxococcota bacterium]